MEIYGFIEDFTNWFLKFNRARLKGKEDTMEKSEWLISLNICVYVVNMFNVAIAPFTPFLSETIYKNLRENNISLYSKESVLLEEYPSDLEGRNLVSERRFKLFQSICDTIRSIRNQVGLASVKTPVKNIKLFTTNDQIIEDLECMREYFNSDEINILNLEISKQTEMNLEVSIDSRFGKIYRAGLKSIKDFLSIQTQEQLKEIVESEVFKVGDIEVKKEHLVVKYVSSIVIEKNEVESICQVNGEKITVILDKTQDQSVLEKHFMRMVIYHTQKIRKNSGVRPWFKILFFYEISNSQLKSLLETSMERISIDLGFPVSLEEPSESFGKWADETFSYSLGEKEENIHLIIFKME
jgi:isoleucyl-tRNA synthetase